VEADPFRYAGAGDERMAGVLLSIVLSMFELSDAYYIPVHDLYLVTVGIAVAISLLLCGVSRIAIRRPVKNMLKKSVVEELRNTESS